MTHRGVHCRCAGEAGVLLLAAGRFAPLLDAGVDALLSTLHDQQLLGVGTGPIQPGLMGFPILLYGEQATGEGATEQQYDHLHHALSPCGGRPVMTRAMPPRMPSDDNKGASQLGQHQIPERIPKAGGEGPRGQGVANGRRAGLKPAKQQVEQRRRQAGPQEVTGIGGDGIGKA